jgi:hypothetical protein
MTRAACAVALLLLAFVPVIMPTSESAYSASKRRTTFVSTVNADVLSSQQKLLVQKFGQPDAFLIAFEAEEGEDPAQPATRVETWSYHRNLTSFSFVNGKFCGSKQIDTLPARSLTGSYQPDQFRFGQTIEQIREVLKLDEKQVAKVAIDELGLETPLPKGLVLYYAPQLVLGFADNKLHFVQTMICSEVDQKDQK